MLAILSSKWKERFLILLVMFTWNCPYATSSLDPIPCPHLQERYFVTLKHFEHSHVQFFGFRDFTANLMIGYVK